MHVQYDGGAKQISSVFSLRKQAFDASDILISFIHQAHGRSTQTRHTFGKDYTRCAAFIPVTSSRLVVDTVGGTLLRHRLSAK